MFRKPYYIGYQRIGGGPIVLEGPFRDRDLASNQCEQLRAQFECSVNLSEPFIAYSVVQALKRAIFLINNTDRADALEGCSF